MMVVIRIQDDSPSINEDSDDDFILDDDTITTPEVNGASSMQVDAQPKPRTPEEDAVLEGDLGLGDHQMRSRGILSSTDPAPTRV